MRHCKGGTQGKHAVRFALAAILASVTVVVAVAPVFAYHYSDVVLSDLPGYYLPADAGSGSTVADAAHGGSCSITGGSLWDANGFVAGSSARLKGDGSNYCSRTSGVSFAYSSWSMEMWVKVTSLPGSDTVGFQVSGNDGSSDQGLAFIINGSHIEGHNYWTGHGPLVSWGSCGLTTSANHYVVWTHPAGGTDHIYVDATSCASDASGYSNTVTSCRYGILAGPGNCGGGFAGFGAANSSTYVGQVAYYGYALTGTQISAHYSAITAPPAATLFVSPTFEAVRAGHPIEYVFSSTDATGAAADGSPYTLTSSTPAGACSSLVAGGGGLVCTASTTLGVYTLNWADTLGNTAVTQLDVVGLAASFAVLPTTCNTTLDSSCNFQAFAFSTAGVDITGTDPWGFGTLPTNAHCSDTTAPGSSVHIVNCYATATGSYTIPFSDAQGLPATVTMVVSAVRNQQSCTTDVGCWVSNLIGAVSAIPGDILNGIGAVLFTSANGPSYLDFTPLTANIFPTVSCRSGQTPTAADGIHCLAFPFSIPADIGGFITLLNATPAAPTMDIHWDFPLWTGITLHETGSIDPRIVLSDTTMMYVRDIELVLFIIGTGMGTWRLLQLVGVG